MDNLSVDPDALTQHTIHEIVEKSGTQGVEILNWIAARGALGAVAHEVTRTYHIPISNTAAAVMVLETDAAKAGGTTNHAGAAAVA